MNGSTAAGLLRMMPGQYGTDSPVLADDIPAARWDAWVRVVVDRSAGRRSPIEDLAVATGYDLEASSWPRWWDRDQPGGVLTHRAAVVRVDGGGVALVSACGFSEPYRDQAPRPAWGTNTAREAGRTYCVRCDYLT